MSHATLRQFESGNRANLSIDQITALCRALKISFEVLVPELAGSDVGRVVPRPEHVAELPKPSVEEAPVSVPAPAIAPANDVLRPQEAAEYTKLSSNHLAQLRLRGTGPKYLQPTPRTVLYRRSDLDTWLNASERTRTSGR